MNGIEYLFSRFDFLLFVMPKAESCPALPEVSWTSFRDRCLGTFHFFYCGVLSCEQILLFAVMLVQVCHVLVAAVLDDIPSNDLSLLL